ncbi:hypothetical protein AB205_0201670 [Aquarana catesbeiana]|uniref:MADF domain-containing protein n=1 Tax=Aquarana catesbeiana TaxID=8400 RepID=A0A2G9QAQ4_AQUCT|nr:hypothetical protein AB205_0201670 [Aquarana catesbeiana]
MIGHCNLCKNRKFLSGHYITQESFAQPCDCGYIGLKMASAVSQVELISAVQAHPELWDVAHPLHGDHIRKVKAWEDICAAITPGWEQLRNAERKEISKIMQRRWKSLRDRVRRDLTDEDKAARSGAPAPTKKKRVPQQSAIPKAKYDEPYQTVSFFHIFAYVHCFSGSMFHGYCNHFPNATCTYTSAEWHGCTNGRTCTSLLSCRLGDALSHFEESRAVETPSPASHQGGEQRGRGGVRGRGRQTRGGFNPEADDRVLALLQEVRQERRSMDAFLDTNNPRACFCRSLYHILEDIGGDQEKLCMDHMYAIAMQYRHAKLSGGPPPCDPYNVSHDPPMAPGTSAVLAPPSHYQPPPQRQPPPMPSQTSYHNLQSYGEFPPSTSHFQPSYPVPRYQQDFGSDRQAQPLPRPQSPHPQCNQPSTTTYHQL